MPENLTTRLRESYICNVDKHKTFLTQNSIKHGKQNYLAENSAHRHHHPHGHRHHAGHQLVHGELTGEILKHPHFLAITRKTHRFAKTN